MLGRRGHQGGSYPYVRAWGGVLGSPAAYVEEQVTRAAAAQAPPAATHEIIEAGPTGQWALAGEVPDDAFRRQLHALAQAYAGHRLPAPRSAVKRCEHYARKPAGDALCDRPLDAQGRCDRQARHITWS